MTAVAFSDILGFGLALGVVAFPLKALALKVMALAFALKVMTLALAVVSLLTSLADVRSFTGQLPFQSPNQQCQSISRDSSRLASQQHNVLGTILPSMQGCQLMQQQTFVKRDLRWKPRVDTGLTKHIFTVKQSAEIVQPHWQTLNT